jgi:hypothetical protein
MSNGGRFFALFCSERDHKPQNSGCGYTARSFHTGAQNPPPLALGCLLSPIADMVPERSVRWSGRSILLSPDPRAARRGWTSVASPPAPGAYAANRDGVPVRRRFSEALGRAAVRVASAASRASAPAAAATCRASASRPMSVIVSHFTLIGRPPAYIVPGAAVASPSSPAAQNLDREAMSQHHCLCAAVRCAGEQPKRAAQRDADHQFLRWPSFIEARPRTF